MTGTVAGTLYDGDGQTIAAAKVSLFAEALRGETHFVDTTTAPDGTYTATYTRTTAPNLLVRAYDSKGNIVATSPTVFAAPSSVVIDLTSAADGVIRAPATYSVVNANVTAQLNKVPITALVENSATHEIQFVANAAAASFNDVAYLYLANVIGPANRLRADTLFGLFSRRIPPALDAALLEPPDAGLDATFASQILTGVLAHSRATLDAALTAAIAGGTLPPSYASSQSAQLDALDQLRVTAVNAAPYLRGKTALSALLTTGQVTAAVASAFSAAYAANGGRLGATWKTLRANTQLPAGDLATLNTTLSVGEIFAGNLLLVGDTLARLGQKTLVRVSDLALLDETDWVARITALDPNATTIPPVLPDDTPTQRIARFAKAISERLTGRYPTTALRGGWTKATSSAFATKAELVAVLAAHPDLDLRGDAIDPYIATQHTAISAAALAELKTAQRLLRVSPHYASVEALKAAGYQSAQSIYFAGRAPFIAKMTAGLGSASLAQMAYARAQMTYATALATYARFNLSLNGTPVAALGSAIPDATTLENLPDLQALFGPQDYFECTECQSVYSPAAYLADLLQYLKQFGAAPLAGAPAPLSAITNARDALLYRRPDIQYIALDCNNTEIEIPYIDLVNEILEAFVAPLTPPPQPIIIQTIGTTAERRALPQHISPAAYDTTHTAVFPFGLPFDLPFTQTTSYLRALGASRGAILELFGAAPALSINPAMQAVIAGTDGHQPWERWGFASQHPVSVVDPSTRTTFAPADWVAALNRVPVLLNRAGLTLPQLYQLLEVAWVTGGAVTLHLGVDASGVVSASTEAMTFAGLTADVLDRAQRFLRLCAATELQMWELDWALAHAAGGALDATFLTFLTGAIAVARRLNLPFQQVLGFWSSIEVRDVANHLGDEDTVQPATYSALFTNPAMVASWASVFPKVTTPATFALGGGELLPSEAAPTPAQSANLNATAAALGISGDDIALIIAATNPATANSLTLATITVLVRYARVAFALGLAISDLVLWLALTDGTPFGTTPADTLECLRRLDVLRRSGLGVRDLDYLLRGSSEDQTALAFTPPQQAELLQRVRDAIAKLTSAQQAEATTISTLIVAAVATATGVTANVAAPLIAKTGILPLPAATVAGLLAATIVDPVQFPALTAAFSSIARGAALYTAIGASEVEFGFVVANAGTFGWLDPAALPTTVTSPYSAFEALQRAIALDRRQAARAPKLFDVLAAWLVPGQLPPDVAGALAGTATVPALATALGGSTADVAAITAALHAKAPSLTAATRPGSLSDVAMLAAVGAALDVATRYGIRGSTLVLLASAAPDAGTATAAIGAFQAQFPQSAWFGAVQPIEDDLRQRRRDALVAYILGSGANAAPLWTFVTADDVFDYFLIDPEMCACAQTTRLLQASLAVQQFVQQTFLAMTIQCSVATTDPRWREWSWRKQYALWQANREVFLYPENYVLPELRKDASPLFENLENDLRQATCDATLAETAYESYLRGLVDVSNLVIAAHYNETAVDGSLVLHVFAHTRATPYAWWYRTRTKLGPTSAGSWTAWTPLGLDIAADQVMPVVWDGRLHLVWPTFTLESQKQAEQSVPTGGGGEPRQVPIGIWAVQFAISDLRAGQWQAKRTINEKMFLLKNADGVPHVLVDRPALAFTFRVTVTSADDLQINAYYRPNAWERQYPLTTTNLPNLLVGSGILPSIDSPMLVSEVDRTIFPILPPAALVDQTQEPSYARITTTTTKASLATPFDYGFAGQDLICGSYEPPTNTLTTVQPVPLLVLAQNALGGSLHNVELAWTMMSPHIVVPQQEPAFDSLEPFFVVDGGRGNGTTPRPARTYLVEPELFTVGSSPIEFEPRAYVQKWTTSYAFETFYHPFARTMLRELERGGLAQLMARELQLQPAQVRGWAFDFASTFTPGTSVARPYPDESELDFRSGSSGAYSLYNWEVFYHAPMFVASLLAQNQKFGDALTWLEYIFDPMDASGGPAPQRFWQLAPFNQLTASQWTAQQIQNILASLAEGVSDPATAAALDVWMNDPFDPHAIAGLRTSAYAKATVMKLLDNVIAWGDSLFATYNAETVGQAAQLYILAELILGPAPQEVRLPPQPATQPLTYAQIENQLDAFSNTLVAVENLVVAPTPPASMVDGSASLPTLPMLPGNGQTLFFGVPPNDQLLAYWSTVADRLYKIRHCLNLQGQAVPLPLYAPGVNPLLAASIASAGGVPSGLSAPPPIYRFPTYLQKAIELTGDVRQFGALILSALEKKDAETLELLRANQELDIQTRVLDIKNLQVTEANDQIAALQSQKVLAKIRYDFYSQIAFLNAWESSALALQAAAAVVNQVAVVLDTTASVASLVPSSTFGAAGFGGSPMATVTYGGGNVADASTSTASAMRGEAYVMSELAGTLATFGSYQRRMDDWQLQAQLANAELTQLDSQITAATDRLNIANSELAIQNRTIANSQSVRDFLANKYTKGALYDWMVAQLMTVYAQAYQLAYGLAQQAQSAYQYELGLTDTFIQFGYWDSQHRGLTAGESLTFDLRRMEAQYLAQNVRELELTKHISLALTQPMSFVQLIETGSCQILLNEALFDADHPGQYFRRLRNVAVTIPCVTGPYTGVNANLTLTSSVVRTTATLPAGGYVPATAQPPPTDPATFSLSAQTAAISTSSGQNDSGVFDANLRDERWLPFEGQGAISAWNLELSPADNAFDFSTITDVVLHVRYTARAGIAESIVRAAITPAAGVSKALLVSVKNTFGDALYSFFHPTDTTATQQVLTLPISARLFPFSNLGAPEPTGVALFFALAQVPLSGTTMATTFGPPGGTANPLTFTTALPAGWTGTPALLSASTSLAAAAPQPLVLTVPGANVPTALATTAGGQTRLDPAKVTDLVLVLTYTT
ncbi:MAG TPA: neuraminidase-like domain-containing protein [Kofleriaceae bacterium]|jgi:hypothetical protein